MTRRLVVILIVCLVFLAFVMYQEKTKQLLTDMQSTGTKVLQLQARIQKLPPNAVELTRRHNKLIREYNTLRAEWSERTGYPTTDAMEIDVGSVERGLLFVKPNRDKAI